MTTASATPYSRTSRLWPCGRTPGRCGRISSSAKGLNGIVSALGSPNEFETAERRKVAYEIRMRKMTQVILKASKPSEQLLQSHRMIHHVIMRTGGESE